MTMCHFIPPYLLERLASSHPDAQVCEWCRRTLELDTAIRAARDTAQPPAPTAGGGFAVYTANNGSALPGDEVRAKGAPATGEEATDEAYSGVDATLAMYAEVFDRDSFDDKGALVRATVHYEKDYDNAFWNGQQLVFGDGDGKVFGLFTRPIDVLGHEFTHAVTQYTANLTYNGQSGALNESISDVFGSCLKQRVNRQSAAQADWLIGAGIFLPSVQGKALRSMAEPGTAYDDPVLGKDPQVASMKDYVNTTEDNGGVHTNSGIPNRAFNLAATAIGGNSWEGAGPIWYSALTSGIAADTDFAGFAAATDTAAQRVSTAAADAVRQAWTTVGVLGTTVPSGGGDNAPDQNLVSVTRSGGVAGARKQGSVVLGEDPRTPQVESLLDRIDFAAVATSQPRPDMFVYAFSVRGSSVVVNEGDLSGDLAELARIVLG